MRVPHDKGSSKHCCDGACQLSLRHILFLFLFLLIFVIFNLLASTSRLKYVVDVSMKMKADVLDVIHDIVDLKEAKSINGTFTIRSIRQDGSTPRDGNAKPISETIQNVNKSKLAVTAMKSLEENEKTNLPWIFQTHPISQTFRKSPPKMEFKSRNQIDRRVLALSRNPNVLKERERNADTSLEKNDSSYLKILGNAAGSDDHRRKDSCDTCFQHNFNYVIDNPNVCKMTSSVNSIDILIVILTVHKNTKARNALRETWLSPYTNNTRNIRYVFLLGEVESPDQQEQVRQENELHHDIIKEDFIDSYMNLTYKTIMGFKWASTKCGHARFVLKTDDDMYVNTNNLLHVVSTYDSVLQQAIGGSCNLKARPIRHKKSKWYASFSSYPDTYYPGFCSGTGYVTSMNVARKVYEISPSVPFFHLEDVYSALCIRKLGFSLKPIGGFNAGRPRLDPCVYKGQKLVTAHQLSPVMLQMVWRRKCVLKIHVPLSEKRSKQ